MSLPECKFKFGDHIILTNPEFSDEYPETHRITGIDWQPQSIFGAKRDKVNITITPANDLYDRSDGWVDTDMRLATAQEIKSGERML